MFGLSMLNPWKWGTIGAGIGCVALGIMLLFARADADHWHQKADRCVELRKLDKANYTKAATEARLKATEAARQKELQNAKISEETQNVLSVKLENARAIANDYARRLRNNGAAAARSGRQADPGGTSTAARDPVGAGEGTVISVADLQICTENTVKAQGWQDWYRQISTPIP